MVAVCGRRADAGLVKGCVPTMRRAYLHSIELMRGESGVKMDSEWTAA